MKYQEKSWRNDGYEKVTGNAKFTDDLSIHGILHAVPVYTDFVHAKIKSINIESAQTAAGVVGVITAKDKKVQIELDKSLKTTGFWLMIK